MKGLSDIKYADYLNEFNCLGGKCEDTCCKEWSIYIDKNTYEEYCSIKDSRVREFVTSNIDINDNSENLKLDYGVIKLKKDKKCPFLDKEKLCSIQKFLGDEYLSNVCSSFPRVITKINGKYEVSLNVSCIEAARVILLRKKKVDFIYGTKYLNKFEPVINVDTKDDFYNNTNGQYLVPMRKLSIDIIQDRNHNIYERFYILGNSLEYISEKLTYDFDNFNMILKDYKHNLNNILKVKEHDNMDYVMQVGLFKNILSIIKKRNSDISIRFNEIMINTEEGFKFNDGRSIMDKKYMYVEAYRTVEESIKNNYSHIFENYFANFIFQSFFPFSESDDMIEDYIFICIRFSLIVFFIVGNYLWDSETLDENFIVGIIQLLTKDIDHNKNGMREINNYLRKNQLFNLNFVRILV